MPIDPSVVFELYLTLLQDPASGEKLYELHAPEAIIRDGAGVNRAVHTAASSFAALHREISLQGENALPHLWDPALVHRVDDAARDETVAWFAVQPHRLRETAEPRQVSAAVGIRVVAGTPRIGWATLAQKMSPEWSYANGYLQSLADYPWMKTSEPARARTLLDASYFRQFWESPVEFNTLPDAHFACQMSTVCCKHDFEIALPVEAQLLIDALPWSTLRPGLTNTRLEPRPDGKLQLKSINESCRFLGSLGQCLIHQTLGRQPFGPCNIFPVVFAHTPEGVDVALSPICDSTRGAIGPPLRERSKDLRERLAHSDPPRPQVLRLLPDAEIAWGVFREVEQGLCGLLSTDYLPMRRRLYLGSRLLAALRTREPIALDRWLQEPLQDITGEMRQSIHGMLDKVLAWDREVLRSLPRRIPDNLAHLEINEPEMLSRILRNTLFGKTYSYPYDLTTAHNVLVLLYLLALLMQEASANSITARMWRELGALGVHGLLKSVLMHEGVPEGFRYVFGTAEFGLWMLAA